MSESEGPRPEEMRMPSPAEVVLSSAQLLVTLAADAIEARERLDEAQLAIDAVDALLPVVERLVTPDQLRQYRQVVSQLQLGFVEASRPAPAPPPEAAPQPEPVVETPERPKIWTPGGDV
jgi:hypothetical protein